MSANDAIHVSFVFQEDDGANDDSLRAKRKKQQAEVQNDKEKSVTFDLNAHVTAQVAQQVHGEVTFRCSTTGTKYHTDGLSEE